MPATKYTYVCNQSSDLDYKLHPFEDNDLIWGCLQIVRKGLEQGLPDALTDAWRKEYCKRLDVTDEYLDGALTDLVTETLFTGWYAPPCMRRLHRAPDGEPVRR